MWDCVWSTGEKEKAEEVILSCPRKNCICWVLLWPAIMAL